MNSSERRHSAYIPDGLLIGAAALIMLTMIAAGIARHSGAYITQLPPTRMVASRDLRFEDRADRGVDIRDNATGALVETVPPKTGGFLRGVMRALVFEARARLGHSDDVPDHSFRLTQWADGRLSLDDPTTHERIELEAFGSTNREVFARLLK